MSPLINLIHLKYDVQLNSNNKKTAGSNRLFFYLAHFCFRNKLLQTLLTYPTFRTLLYSFTLIPAI